MANRPNRNSPKREERDASRAASRQSGQGQIKKNVLKKLKKSQCLVDGAIKHIEEHGGEEATRSADNLADRSAAMTPAERTDRRRHRLEAGGWEEWRCYVPAALKPCLKPLATYLKEICTGHRGVAVITPIVADFLNRVNFLIAQNSNDVSVTGGPQDWSADLSALRAASGKEQSISDEERERRCAAERALEQLRGENQGLRVRLALEQQKVANLSAHINAAESDGSGKAAALICGAVAELESVANAGAEMPDVATSAASGFLRRRQRLPLASQKETTLESVPARIRAAAKCVSTHFGEIDILLRFYVGRVRELERDRDASRKLNSELRSALARGDNGIRIVVAAAFASLMQTLRARFVRTTLR